MLYRLPFRSSITTFSFLMFLLCVTACKKRSDKTETRSFYMGVTPWPASFDAQAVSNTYRFINGHCDIVAHHFDEGIPYDEAYNGSPMPDSLRNNVQFRKANTGNGKVILLSVSALNLSRHQKADHYLPTLHTDSVVNYWKNLPVNDPKVVTAYVNYISYLVNTLQPSYVNYGVESNDLSWDPVKFVQYRDFLSKVYGRLKAAYPALPFFVSFMVNEDPRAIQYATQLIDYTDYITLSAYPYLVAGSTAGGNTDPALFPADFFTRFLDLAPSKPWAFAETGYIAEDLIIPAYNLNRKGTDKWQRDYLDIIFRLCNERKARFLIWFCHKDFDAGNDLLKQLGLYQDLFGFWEDTGLEDENGRQRPSYDLWLQWNAKVKQ